MIDCSGYCAHCHRDARDCKGGVWRRSMGGVSLCRNCWYDAGRSFGELPSEGAIDLAARRPARREEQEA